MARLSPPHHTATQPIEARYRVYRIDRFSALTLHAFSSLSGPSPDHHIKIAAIQKAWSRGVRQTKKEKSKKRWLTSFRLATDGPVGQGGKGISECLGLYLTCIALLFL